MQPQLAEIEYPESDGKPMWDNTLQADWIILLRTNLDALFADFVANIVLPIRVAPTNNYNLAQLYRS